MIYIAVCNILQWCGITGKILDETIYINIVNYRFYWIWNVLFGQFVSDPSRNDFASFGYWLSKIGPILFDLYLVPVP